MEVLGVTSYGEVFNPHFIGFKDKTSLLGIDLAARDHDPLALLARIRKRTEGMTNARQSTEAS